MGQKPNLRKRRERVRQQLEELEEEEEQDYIPTTAEQKQRLGLLWKDQFDTEKQVGWSLGMLSIFVSLVSVGAIAFQIQSPWSLQHFAVMKPVVSGFELVLGLLPICISAALIGAGVTISIQSQRPLLIVALVIGTGTGVGWGAAFVAHSFWSWQHLWLVFFPPLFPAACLFLVNEVQSSRKEIREAEKTVFEHETA